MGLWRCWIFLQIKKRPQFEKWNNEEGDFGYQHTRSTLQLLRVDALDDTLLLVKYKGKTKNGS